MRIQETDMGFDLVYQGKTLLLPVGHSTSLDCGTLADYGLTLFQTQGGLVCNRSSLLFKHNLVVGLGCIDQGYSGTLTVSLTNHGLDDYLIETGDRVAQLVIIQLAQYPIRNTQRQDRGFGSSGK